LDQPVLVQRVDDRVQRAVVELDALLLAALLQRRGDLVRVHRALDQAAEHGQRQGIGHAPPCHIIPPGRLLYVEYSWPVIRCQGEFRRVTDLAPSDAPIDRHSATNPSLGGRAATTVGGVTALPPPDGPDVGSFEQGTPGSRWALGRYL